MNARYLARYLAHLLALLLTLLAPPAHAQPPQPAPAPPAAQTHPTPPPHATTHSIPIGGDEVPALAHVDALVLDFMAERGISAATVAITRNRALIFSRSYGWSDEARSTPLAQDALMRIASISKPITAAAVRRLIAEGAFTLDSLVFNLDPRNAESSGLLSLEPFPSLSDPRLASITVRHLLEHKGGWDRDLAGDLTYVETAIASAMEIPSPPGRENTLRFILGKPLQHDPGTKAAYSNIGMLALGIIVEQQSAKPLDEIFDEIMSIAGVAPEDHGSGRTFKQDQSPREPHYDASGFGLNVYDPSGPPVRSPYGTWDHEARIGQGGQIATAEALARFAAHFHVNGPMIGQPIDPRSTGSWRRNHTGSLAGTNAVIRNRSDGLTFAVIFNKRPGAAERAGGDYASQIRARLDELLDALVADPGFAWPTPQHTPR